LHKRKGSVDEPSTVKFSREILCNEIIWLVGFSVLLVTILDWYNFTCISFIDMLESPLFFNSIFIILNPSQVPKLCRTIESPRMKSSLEPWHQINSNVGTGISSTQHVKIVPPRFKSWSSGLWRHVMW